MDAKPISALRIASTRQPWRTARLARPHDCDAIRGIAGEDRSGGDIGVHRGHSSWKIILN
jgi:hypothetical protein